MDTLALVVDIAVVVIAAYLVWDVVKAYRSAVGNVFQRSLAAAKGAAASLWTGFTVIVTMTAGGLAYIAGLVNAPSVATAITTYASPRIIAVVMIASALVLEAVHARKA